MFFSRELKIGLQHNHRISGMPTVRPTFAELSGPGQAANLGSQVWLGFFGILKGVSPFARFCRIDA